MSQITRFCGVKLLAWKSGCVKFWTNIMSVLKHSKYQRNLAQGGTLTYWRYWKYQCNKVLVMDVKIVINVLLAPMLTGTTWQWHLKWSSNFEPINFRDEVVHWQIIIMIISTFTPGVASQKDWIGQKHLKALWIVNTSAGNLLKFCCRASTEYRVAISD